MNTTIEQRIIADPRDPYCTAPIPDEQVRAVPLSHLAANLEYFKAAKELLNHWGLHRLEHPKIVDGILTAPWMGRLRRHDIDIITRYFVALTEMQRYQDVGCDCQIIPERLIEEMRHRNNELYRARARKFDRVN